MAWRREHSLPPHTNQTEKEAPQAHEQGALKTTRKHILEVLTLRLQFDATQTFKSTLDAIDNLQYLEQLFSAAMRVESPEDFTKILNENGD
jgi:hypothetical protein